jgi:hypothetical protein
VEKVPVVYAEDEAAKKVAAAGAEAGSAAAAAQESRKGHRSRRQSVQQGLKVLDRLRQEAPLVEGACESDDSSKSDQIPQGPSRQISTFSEDADRIALLAKIVMESDAEIASPQGYLLDQCEFHPQEGRSTESRSNSIVTNEMLADALLSSQVGSRRLEDIHETDEQHQQGEDSDSIYGSSVLSAETPPPESVEAVQPAVAEKPKPQSTVPIAPAAPAAHAAPAAPVATTAVTTVEHSGDPGTSLTAAPQPAAPVMETAKQGSASSSSASADEVSDSSDTRDSECLSISTISDP